MVPSEEFGVDVPDDERCPRCNSLVETHEDSDGRVVEAYCIDCCEWEVRV